VNRRAFFASSVAFGVAVIACAKTDEPADPVWGKEPCAHCSMIVGDKRYAGQIGGDGERKFFDDVGCMASWLEKHDAGHAWVRDEDGRWVDARTARYAEGAKTPMDFGFVPAKAGIDWEELRSRLGKRGVESR
jgi:copper chaperone NosL